MQYAYVNGWVSDSYPLCMYYVITTTATVTTKHMTHDT